ncbi:mercury resistance system periplasmic binding protein MerP [Oxalobacteraceae bacterium R-40]|uniref:Periplasmic mercury ion-binding protein n=1 Tax=Keguizhuia sedimenti TaxID=3064264 RepID=A0ABU1BM75_9BURK|nr:mercury resistance system periplasmic binding protein MerP [Oxalobacteraceae bacterium R-40]
MRTIFSLAAFVVATMASPITWAGPQTVTLDVPGMNCSTCPITVKKALTKLDGVEKVQTSLKEKKAVVTFNNDKVSADKLIAATTNAGFPSKVKTEK